MHAYVLFPGFRIELVGFAARPVVIRFIFVMAVAVSVSVMAS